MKRTAVVLLWTLAVVFTAGNAIALTIAEIEANNSLAGAQSIDGFFSLGLNSDVKNSTTIPYVSITGQGDAITSVPASRTYDYFRFTVTVANSQAIFDIDYAYPGSDTTIALWDSTGTPLIEEDNTWGDCTVDPGGSACYKPAGQTERLRDPFLQYTFAATGVYYFGIAESAALSDPVVGGWYYVNPFLGDIANPLEVGDTYTLHVSLENSSPIPEPSTVLLLALGLGGLAHGGRARRVGTRAASGGSLG